MKSTLSVADLRHHRQQKNGDSSRHEIIYVSEPTENWIELQTVSETTERKVAKFLTAHAGTKFRIAVRAFVQSHVGRNAHESHESVLSA